MTRIEVEKRDIKASTEQVFTYLADFNNYQEMMPESVSNWESDKDQCSLQVSMVPKIHMKIVERLPQHTIKIKGSGPFDFDLTVSIETIDASHCRTGMVFEADINPFMKMMIEKPMGQFFGYLTKQVQKKFEV
jgi:carbon monoxide dehydrogenase subunit G